MPNQFYDEIRRAQGRIESYVRQIFAEYENELSLRLGNLNLLQNEHNCLESSTAIGFILEEFLVSRLEASTLNNEGPEDFRIRRSADAATTSLSYDCSSWIGDIRMLINVKVNKRGSSNDAVAAIGQLYKDFVRTDPTVGKCFLVLKVNYDFGCASDGERKIFINDVMTYFLDEVDLSREHKQDHRNWSEEFQADSGRLLVSNAFRCSHRVPSDQISYANTVAMLEAVKQRNSVRQ